MAISWRAALAAIILVASSLATASPALALTYDGTNPAATPCGDRTHLIYNLGWITGSGGSPANATKIYAGSTLIGTVELRHSAYCATVWARVTNLTGSPVQSHETIRYWTDSNGASTPSTQTESDTIPVGGTGWSHQFRDRASFQATGEIFYAGAWRSASTARTVAWVQSRGAYADNPYACDHSTGHPCVRWPTGSTGGSSTQYYWMSSDIYAMPNGAGGTRDVSGDVQFMFGKFNVVPAPSPIFYLDASSVLASVYIFADDLSANGWLAATTGHVTSSSAPYYGWADIVLSNASSWGSSSASRSTFCHEIDHLMGLDHVWWHTSFNIDNVGSKATCVGDSIPAGPSIDDVSAMQAIYANSAP